MPATAIYYTRRRETQNPTLTREKDIKKLSQEVIFGFRNASIAGSSKYFSTG